MKTVHGADFYAKRKHKGTGDSGSGEDGNGSNGMGSPTNEDNYSIKTTSLMSPSIKSESDINSPGYPATYSPSGVSNMNSDVNDEFDYVPMSNHTSHVGNTQIGIVSSTVDSQWPYEEEDTAEVQCFFTNIVHSRFTYTVKFQVSELPMVLRAMIDFDQNPGAGGVSVMAPVDHHAPHGRFRSRLQNKGGLLQPPSPNDYLASASPRSIYGIGELNRRINDLKVDNPALSPPQTFIDNTSKLLELGQNYPNYPNCHYQPTMMQFNQHVNQPIRRDSNNSTTSSSYYSMKSCDVSRRSSQQSHTSSMSTIRPSNSNYYEPQSFYDPISAGSSRRSSQMSVADYGPPSSQLLTSHLARLQRHSAPPMNHPYYTGYSYQQNQYYATYNQQNADKTGNFYNYNHHQQQNLIFNANHTPTSSTDRRMSEPISNHSRNADVAPTQQTVSRRPRSTTPTKSLKTGLEQTKEKEKMDKDLTSLLKPHPNETVVLDVLKTNEKIENCDELVIPDEMVMYLNQVGDETTVQSTAVGPTIKRDLDAEEPATSISIEKIKEEDLFTLLAEVEVKSEDNAVAGVDGPEINNNSDCNSKSENKSQILCKS